MSLLCPSYVSHVPKQKKGIKPNTNKTKQVLASDTSEAEREEAIAALGAWLQVYLTESVYQAALPKSIPAQTRQLIFIFTYAKNKLTNLCGS